MSHNNFYITTPIYYPSGEPHMGHAYSSILADVFARFKRNDNCKVYFLTGTDEHGLKIQKAAEKSNLDPKIYCDKISKVFKDLTKKLNLSNDDFIRTTEKRHYKAVNDLWSRLLKSGDIYLSKTFLNTSAKVLYFLLNDSPLSSSGLRVILWSFFFSCDINFNAQSKNS